MRRRFQLKSKKILTGPYLVWAIAFIIIPIIMVFYYGLTDSDGRFTFLNLAEITTPENLKALGLSLLLSFISTIICLLLAYPLAMILSNKSVNQSSCIVFIFILPSHRMVVSYGRIIPFISLDSTSSYTFLSQLFF